MSSTKKGKQTQDTTEEDELPAIKYSKRLQYTDLLPPSRTFLFIIIYS